MLSVVVQGFFNLFASIDPFGMSLELSHLNKQGGSCYSLGGNEDEVSSCSQSALREA